MKAHVGMVMCSWGPLAFGSSFKKESWRLFEMGLCAKASKYMVEYHLSLR